MTLHVEKTVKLLLHNRYRSVGHKPGAAVDWGHVLFDSDRRLRQGGVAEPVLKTSGKEFCSETTVSVLTLDVDGCFVEIALTASTSAL
jgi:hypothetical protein